MELRSIALVNGWDFNAQAYRALAYAPTTVGGRCYGMAATSGLYFVDGSSRPGPGPVSGYCLSDPAVASQINRAFALQFVRSAEGGPAEAYERLWVELSRGHPVLFAFGPAGGGGHAVLAIQAARFASTGRTHVLSYDSNLVGESGPIGVEVAWVSDDGTAFGSPWYTPEYGFDTMDARSVRLSTADVEALVRRR